MKVYYDDEVDALYLKLGEETPEGVIEISEGVRKIDIKTILSYTLELDRNLLSQKVA